MSEESSTIRLIHTPVRNAYCDKCARLLGFVDANTETPIVCVPCEKIEDRFRALEVRIEKLENDLKTPEAFRLLKSII